MTSPSLARYQENPARKGSLIIELVPGRFADHPYCIKIEEVGLRASYQCYPDLLEAITAFAAELIKLPDTPKFTAATNIIRERISIALSLKKTGMVTT